MLAGLRERGARSVFVRYLEGLGGHPTADAVLAAITVTLAWGPLMRKRISRLTVETLPWWMRLFGTLIGASVEADRHEADRFCGIPNEEILGRRSLTEVAYLALLGQEAASRGPVRLPDPDRPAADRQRPGRHQHPGRQGGGVGRRPGARRSGCSSTRLWSVFCLTAATRTAATATRASPSCSTSSGMPGWKDPSGPEPRHRPEGAGDALHGGVRALQVEPEELGQPGHPEDPGRQPPGVQGQAGQL